MCRLGPREDKSGRPCEQTLARQRLEPGYGISVSTFPQSDIHVGRGIEALTEFTETL